MFFKARSLDWTTTFQSLIALLLFVFLLGHSIAIAAESLKFEVVDKRDAQGYRRTKEICQRLLNAVPQKYRSSKKWQLHLISITEGRNAFATDDGYIAMDYRYLKESDDAIAWVLGHEVTHAVLGHGASLEDFKRSLTDIEKAVQIIIPPTRYRLATKLERDNEDAADSFAFTLVQKAGYNLNNVKEFLQKEAKEESSLMRLVKWLEGSHPTDQERAKVAEERVQVQQKVAQVPQQREPSEKGGEQVGKISEFRTLPNNNFLFQMGSDTETGTTFWRYSKDSSKPCWIAPFGGDKGQSSLEAIIIGEVPDKISLTDDKLAQSLITKALQIVAKSKCGLASPLRIKIVPQGFQFAVDHTGLSFKPTLVDATYDCDFHWGGHHEQVFSGKCRLIQYVNVGDNREGAKSNRDGSL